MVSPLSILDDVYCSKRNINLSTLEKILLLALEIAREGREGRETGLTGPFRERNRRDVTVLIKTD